MQYSKTMSMLLLCILILSILAFPSAKSSVSSYQQKKLPDGIDLCIPIEDSNLASQELSSLGHIKYVDTLEGCEVLVVSSGYLGTSSNVLFEQLANRLTSEDGFVIVIVGAKELRSNFMEIILEALRINGLRIPVTLIGSADAEKATFSIDQRLYTVDIVAISFKPYGYTVVENTSDVVSGIAFAVNNYFEEKQVRSINILGTNMGTRMSPAALIGPTSISTVNWTYIGYIGWKSVIAYGGWPMYEPQGSEEAKVSYYYCSATTGEGTYKFFMAYIQHWAMGYRYVIRDFNPHTFYSITDWNTDLFIDQILDDWGPKNSGTSATITYGLSIGVSGNDPCATASFTYSVPGGLDISWADQTVPSNGFAKTRHYLANPSIDVGYTMEPSSIAFLDPEIDGAEPISVYHQFQIDGDFYCTIYFWANLYNNDVDEV